MKMTCGLVSPQSMVPSPEVFVLKNSIPLQSQITPPLLDRTILSPTVSLGGEQSSVELELETGRGKQGVAK